MKNTYIEKTKNLLDDGEVLTVASAYVYHDIMNLSAVIKALKKKGYDVYTHMVEVNGTSVACYHKYADADYDKHINWPSRRTNFTRGENETKKDAVLRFIQTYGTLTTLDAYVELYSYRISGIIYSLRKDNYKIKTEMVKVDGRKHKIAQYSIEE